MQLRTCAAWALFVVVSGLVVSGCLNLDLPDTTLVTCSESDPTCPSDMRCAERIELCVPLLLPEALTAPNATLVSIEPATIGPGTLVTFTLDVTVDARARVGKAPELTVGGRDAILVSGDHARGDSRFTLNFVVDPDEARNVLPVQVRIFDSFDVEQVIALGAFPLDLDDPELSVTVKGGDIQATRDIVVEWSVSGARTITIAGDVDSAEAFPPLNPAEDRSGELAITLTEGNGVKSVRFRAVDDVGHVGFKELNVTVDDDIPVVALTLSNTLAPSVAGARPGLDLTLAGTASHNRAPQLTLVMLDGAGVPLDATDCAVPSLTPLFTEAEGGGFAVTSLVPIVVPSCPSARAIAARLRVRNDAGVQNLEGSSLSSTLYYDDVAPVVAPIVVDIDRSTAPGRDAIPDDNGNIVVPTTEVSFSLRVSDAHGTELRSIAGPVTSIAQQPLARDETIDLAITLTGGDGDKQASVTIADEVGNVTVAQVPLIVLDRIVPVTPQRTQFTYDERPDDTDLFARDENSTFAIAAFAGAVERGARAFIFEGTQLLAVSAPADVAGAISETFVPGPVDTLNIIAVDRAGNASAPIFISRPTISFVDTDAVLGPNTIDVTFLLTGDFTGGPVVIGSTAARTFGLTVGALPPAGEPITATALGIDDDDSGVDALSVEVIVGGLNALSTSIERAIYTVDFTPPVIDTSRLIIDEAARTVRGAAGAVADRAGADVRPVVGAQLAVLSTTNIVLGTATVASDGSFDVVTLAAGVPDEFRVRATDLIGNVTTATLVAPVISFVTIAPGVVAAAAPNNVITVAFSVAGHVGDPVVVVDDVAAVLVDDGDGDDATYRFTHTVPASAVHNTRPRIDIVAENAIGHERVVTNSVAVVVDTEGPVVNVISPVNPTKSRALRLSLADAPAGGATATFSLRTADAPDVEIASGNLLNNVTVTLTQAELDDGDYVIEFTATDSVGNVRGITEEFEFDDTPPTIAFATVPTDGRSVEVAYALAVTGDPDTFECGVDGVFLPCDVAGIVRAPFGQRSLQFRAKDRAGNDAHIVGDPNTTTLTAPTVTLTPRRKIVASDGLFCSVDVPFGGEGGALHCWGDNRNGALGMPVLAGGFPPEFDEGNGAPFGFIGPTPIWESEGQWKDVAIGGDAICAILASGSMRCWGVESSMLPIVVSSPNGFQGEPSSTFIDNALSSATVVAMNDTRGCAYVPEPRQFLCWGPKANSTIDRFFGFNGGEDVTSIALGDDHGCVLTSQNRVMCFGSNTHGQLGGGPAPPDGLFDVFSDGNGAIDELAVGPRSTCVRRRGSGRVDCFGDNARGALSIDRLFGGNPGEDDDRTRGDFVSPLTSTVSLATEETRTCAVARDTGRIDCHGVGTFGARGDGIAETFVRGVETFGPTLDFTYDSVFTSAGTTCAVRSSDAAIVCAGDSGRGEVLVSQSAATPRAIFVPNVNDAHIEITSRTMCLKTSPSGFPPTSTRMCAGDSTDNIWGHTSSGSVLLMSATFTTIDVLPASGVRTFGLGDGFMCEVQSNRAECVGRNGRFLGRGTRLFGEDPERFPSFQPVVRDNFAGQPLEDVNDVFVGATTACAIVSQPQNQLMCWGSVTPEGPSAIPVVVETLAGGQPHQVAFGDDHVCFTNGSPTLKCFGSDNAGQRGNGNNNSASPNAVVAENGPSNTQAFELEPGGFGTRVAATRDVSCAIGRSVNDSRRGLFCWGSGRNPILDPAYGSAETFPHPDAAVARFMSADGIDNPFENARGIALSGETGCVIDTLGRLQCWGRPLTGSSDFLLPHEFGPRIIDDEHDWDTIVMNDGGVCGLVRLPNFAHELRCVGANTAGRFGDGTGLVLTPTIVLAGVNP